MEPDRQTRLRYREALIGFLSDRPAKDLLHAPAVPQARKGKIAGNTPHLYHHAAECTELAIAAEGELRIATPLEIFHLTGNRLLLIEKGVYHTEVPSASGRYRVLWWHFDRSVAEVHDTLVVSTTVAEASAYMLPGRTDVESIARAIASELSSRNWGYRHAVVGLLGYLACVLIRRLDQGRGRPRLSRETPTVAIDPRKWELIHAALLFCEQHFHHGISVSEVASAVGCSPLHLGQLMSTHLGHSTSDHLRNLRIAEAKHLLERSDLSVSDIAQAVGYSYASHFTRAFTQATGLSPRTYRQRLGAV